MTFAATILFVLCIIGSTSVLTSLDTGARYVRPDVFELMVDMRAKEGVTWPEN